MTQRPRELSKHRVCSAGRPGLWTPRLWLSCALTSAVSGDTRLQASAPRGCLGGQGGVCPCRVIGRRQDRSEPASGAPGCAGRSGRVAKPGHAGRRARTGLPAPRCHREVEAGAGLP